MEKTIIVKGKPFTFEEEHLTHAQLSPISDEDGRELLLTVKRLFEPIGLNFYLAFGTLLGAVRDKGIIKGDEDIDVHTDNEQLLYDSLPYLYENGLKVIRIIPGDTYSFRLNERSFIDVYILRPLHHSVWSSYCYRVAFHNIPKKFFKEYQDIEFLGVTCKCPKDPEKLLAFMYGKTWNTPVRGHTFYYEARSAYFYHHYLSKRSKPFWLKLIRWPYWRHLILSKYKSQKDSLDNWNKSYM